MSDRKPILCPKCGRQLGIVVQKDTALLEGKIFTGMTQNDLVETEPWNEQVCWFNCQCTNNDCDFEYGAEISFNEMSLNEVWWDIQEYLEEFAEESSEV